MREKGLISVVAKKIWFSTDEIITSSKSGAYCFIGTWVENYSALIISCRYLSRRK